MNNLNDPKEKQSQTQVVNGEQDNNEKPKQQQTDPNITELKGLTDPDEELEVKGTDNDFKE